LIKSSNFLLRALLLMRRLFKDYTQIILDSIADGVFTVDLKWRITSFNRAAEKITGISRRNAVGKQCWEVFKASVCEKGCALRQTMTTGKPTLNNSIYIINSKGEKIPVSISTALLKDENKKIIGGVETFRDLSTLEELKKELRDKHTFYDIISKNLQMHRLFRIMEHVAESDSTVLLVGESGTGKELFAKAIHSMSHRKNGPMVIVNCGALPDTLLESELFGYKAGAFTDAKRDKPGRVTLAEGGTLFLDEIGDLPAMLQVKLLRLLQDKTYEPLGSTHPVKANVRIIAATNKDLDRLVQEGKFRDDLYYRINVVKLVIPPLRERKEDIPLLIDHFISRFSRLIGKDIEGVSHAVVQILMSYDFPGNVRELENIIEYATLICDKNIIDLEHLPDNLRLRMGLGFEKRLSITTNKGGSLRDIEKEYIYEVLRQNNWNRKMASKQLGIHPSTLWRKMKRLNIKVPD